MKQYFPLFNANDECSSLDPDILAPVTLDELKEKKPCIKLFVKLEKELDSLRKKNEKVVLSTLDLNGPIPSVLVFLLQCKSNAYVS